MKIFLQHKIKITEKTLQKKNLWSRKYITRIIQSIKDNNVIQEFKNSKIPLQEYKHKVRIQILFKIFNKKIIKKREDMMRLNIFKTGIIKGIENL